MTEASDSSTLSTESARPTLAARVKYRVARAVKRNPYTWAAIWNVLPYCRFMLPHDRSYFGFRHLMSDDDGLFLDVGANNGMSAAGFRILNDHYEILSIEANELHAPALDRLKRRLPRFDFKILAGGRDRGSLDFITPSFRGIHLHAFTSTNRHFLDLALKRDFSPFVRKRLDYIDHQAEVAPLDDLDLTPSIVKIDVEGFDLEVLAGLEKTIRQHRPVVHIEYTPNEMAELEDFCARHRYARFVYDGEEDAFWTFDQKREDDRWRAGGLQVNLFCVPEERAGELPIATPAAAQAHNT